MDSLVDFSPVDTSMLYSLYFFPTFLKLLTMFETLLTGISYPSWFYPCQRYPAQKVWIAKGRRRTESQ